VLLALSVISHQSKRLGASSFRVFDEHGGSIGRGKNNDWILDDPDALLSSRHAIFRSIDGRYLIEDASTNGTGLNHRDSLVPRGQAVPLSDGDRLFLGDFEILVQFIEPIDPGTRAPHRITDADDAVPDHESARLDQSKVRDPSDSLSGAEFGAILRIVTQGLIEVLGDRAAIKRMFRLQLTEFRAAEINPLKSADSVEQALRALFVERHPGGLHPCDAFRQAFEVLVQHQRAMLAGIEAAYSHLLRRFDPVRIEAECDAALKKRGIFRLSRNDYWEYYRQSFAQTFQDSATAYTLVFGESFARAYETEIERLEKAPFDRSPP